MKKIALTLGTFLLVMPVFILSAQAGGAVQNDTTQDFHIDKEGNISVSQAKVMQISGTTFYVRYYVGLAFIRILVKTETSTKVYRRFGDEILLHDITAGDTINFEGKIESGADSLSVIATKITNFSNQKEIVSFKGVITAATAGDTTGSFILTDKNQNTVIIAAGTTTQIRKGSRIIPPGLVLVGDRVIDTVGTYDHDTNTLDANVLVIYVDPKIFMARNFEGTLRSVSAGNPPTLSLNAEGKDYTIILSGNTEILNKQRKKVSIKRYLEGDTVRIYGAIREAEEPIIDAEIVRNVSLQ